MKRRWCQDQRSKGYGVKGQGLIGRLGQRESEMRR